MSDEGFIRARSTHSAVSDADNRQTTTLAIGEPDEWRRAGGMLPAENAIAFCTFDDVTDNLLKQHAPTLILSPVLARRFDCIDLATRLHHLQYGEKYRAIAWNMPNPDIIEREIRSLCPKLDFAVLQTV